jgi:polar amino acid transport system substrate-binding protein
MTDTPERRRAIAFSDPYLSIGLALLVGSNGKLQDPAQLDTEGTTIVVRQGTTGEVWARANLKKAKVLSVDKENAAVLEVVQGKVDGFIYDQNERLAKLEEKSCHDAGPARAPAERVLGDRAAARRHGTPGKN